MSFPCYGNTKDKPSGCSRRYRPDVRFIPSKKLQSVFLSLVLPPIPCVLQGQPTIDNELGLCLVLANLGCECSSISQCCLLEYQLVDCALHCDLTVLIWFQFFSQLDPFHSLVGLGNLTLKCDSLTLSAGGLLKWDSERGWCFWKKCARRKIKLAV